MGVLEGVDAGFELEVLGRQLGQVGLVDGAEAFAGGLHAGCERAVDVLERDGEVQGGQVQLR